MAAWALDTFMLFGDSITQGSFEPGMTGIGQRLSHVYARKLDVLNRGLSGYNTEWSLPVLEQCIANQPEQRGIPKIQLMTIWFGANDACLKHSPQHVPLDLFKANLTKMIQMISSPDSQYYSPSTRIILITPPPINTIQRVADLASRTPPLPVDRDFNVTRDYATAVIEVAKNHSLPCVDAWTSLWKSVGEKEEALQNVLIDGLHLNEAGYQVQTFFGLHFIQTKYPALHHEKIERVFPGYLWLAFVLLTIHSYPSDGMNWTGRILKCLSFIVTVALPGLVSSCDDF